MSTYCIALPSLWEGLPLVLFEALASNRPVIVSDIKAFKSVISDEAIFFRSEDHIDLAKKIRLDLREGEDGLHTFLDGKDVSREIRLPIISEIISHISTYPEVRKIMVQKQRQLAQSGGIVMDGRDIGTIVLPDAEVKIFMDASIEERAHRRYNELKKKGMDVQLLQIKEEIRQRDYIDSSRETSPLVAASDAHIVDTTGLSIKKQVEKIMEIIKTI